MDVHNVAPPWYHSLGPKPFNSLKPSRHSRPISDVEVLFFFILRSAVSLEKLMRKSELVSIIRNLLPAGSDWPNGVEDVHLEGGKTVLMVVVTTVADPKVVVKLIDLVCQTHPSSFWEKDEHNRHVVMLACHIGVHPTVLLRLIKWARKSSLKVVVPMSRRDDDGRDAVELAIRAAHGHLVSCLLGDDDPNWSHDLLCRHWPLEVLERAIQLKNEKCVRDVMANKRVTRDLQPGVAAHLNANARWEQRVVHVKRFFNVFTCVGTAVRCGMPRIVEAIYEVNPKETQQAVWYALYKLRERAGGGQLGVSTGIRRMASEYLLDLLPQLRDIVIVRNWEFLANHKRECSLWRRVLHLRRFSRRDWKVISTNPWTTLPTEMMLCILRFLLPSEALEAKRVANFVAYKRK